MRKGFLIYEKMRKYFPRYEEAVSHIWLWNCSILNFLINEENFIFFFISVLIFVCAGDQGKSHKPAYVVLVGTHADVAPARKNSNGEFTSPTQGILKEKVILLCIEWDALAGDV